MNAAEGTRIAKTLKQLLFDPAAIGPDGAGMSLVEVLVQLTQAINRAAHEMQRYNDGRDPQP